MRTVIWIRVKHLDPCKQAYVYVRINQQNISKILSDGGFMTDRCPPYTTSCSGKEFYTAGGGGGGGGGEW